nr:amino acid permease [uncultured Carboxylicivirga sp.]
MAKVKKFGTFSGVFTPSILTILGVIMYLRFPSIIGQAGLINTLGIIVIAHIISITTSLSVASLSTDKPVQTGGTYFMISRSLGLPIGGTLGLALFVGLSFSVSLYLIGFAESFLQYWNIEININSIRLTGSIVLVVVTTITFISTSLAIKSQYFIMAAILLSLASIFLGNHEFKPTEVHLQPLADAAPFMLLFGIFFPAVTGFEAGVSMSGDLKDPKKSLPLGAMLAVGVGFIVYIGLALFYSYTVDADTLVNDPQVLFKIALVPSLVIAGIWGATLSSALGSILGAPRILQAIAMDKIAPKVFAKGTGKTNEPRNALLLAFVIAEAGILIGELDIIARIVSMFFITTYGFLNLASAIESWSSSDFRPAFKIPRFVSLLGALSAFIVMILLDFLALAGATIVLGLLYFYLQRKELILESGDAWSSFWTNLAKRSLLKLSLKKDNKRNWRPNIILFSGGEKARPYLVDLGLALSGKLGALTDFNLSVNQDIKYPDVKITNGNKKEKVQAYFVREFNCNSVKDGIKTVTSIYGFSGFEPNTVLLGWGNYKNNSLFLLDVLKDLKSKQLNALFLDYDKNNGFGQKEKIDIWWNGKGRHLSFSLNVLRFLLSDASWRDAVVRIIIINSDSSLNDSLYRNTNAILQDKRIKAEVKVLSDDFGSRRKEEIIQTESANTDLIFLGLSHNSVSQGPEYIQNINSICKLPSSILLLSPSEEFDEVNLVDRIIPKSTRQTLSVEAKINPIPQIEIKLVKSKIEKLDADLLNFSTTFSNSTIKNANVQLEAIVSNFQESSQFVYRSLQKDLNEAEKHEYPKIIDRYQNSYLRNSLNIILNENKSMLHEAHEILRHGIDRLIILLGNYLHEADDSFDIPYFIQNNKKEKIMRFPYRKAISYYYEKRVKAVLYEQSLLFEDHSKKVIIELRDLIFDFNDKIDKLDIEKISLSESVFVKDFSMILQRFEILKTQIKTIDEEIANSINFEFRELCNELAKDLSTPEELRKARKKIKSKTLSLDENIATFSENWNSGMLLLNNIFYVDILILTKKIVFNNVISKGIKRITKELSDSFFSKQKVLISNLEESVKNLQNESEPVVYKDIFNIKSQLNESYQKITSLMSDLPEEVILPENLYKNSELISFNDYSQITVNLSQSADYYVDVLFYEPLYRDVEDLESAVKHAVIESGEVNSMLIFHQNNFRNETTGEFTNSTDVKLFDKFLNIITNENAKVNSVLDRIEHNTKNYISDAFSRLFCHSIQNSGKNLRVEEREQKSKRFTNKISVLSKQFIKQFNNSLIFVLNSTSSGIILSKKYLEEVNEETAQPKELLDLIYSLLPDSKIYNSVPVFYRNLMSSGSKINDEFWVSRPNEMKTIKQALNRHRKGFGGAVFITGVHGAGKTSLVRYSVNHLFKPQNIIWINSPVIGSTDVNSFLNELKKNATGFDGFNDIFTNLPYNSVIVINDLELWWERRSGGGEVIEQIIELIRLYGHKVFFMINCNTFSYNLMKQVYPLSECNLATISCSPFNSKELQQMILQRHKSSGISLSYKGKEEENISQLTYSLLFNRYFHLSKGIPGIAINFWKANIRKVKEDRITIDKPDNVNHRVLYQLSNDWLIVLSILIHHKNIDVDKLVRISGMTKEEADKILHVMENSGLIVEKSRNVFTIGRIVEPFITEVCRNKGVI